MTGNYNRFGATFGQVVAYYPKSVVSDFDPADPGADAGGQAAIEATLDRYARMVAAALTPEVYRQMIQVDAECVVRYATAGQTSAALGLVPVRTGTLHLWRYPAEATMSARMYLGGSTPGPLRIDSWFYQKPLLGIGEVASGDFTVNATTGIVTLSGNGILTAGERLFSTYDTDYDAATFALKSLSDATVLAAAVEFGNALYSEGAQKWDLVSRYEKDWEATLGALRSGVLIPDEIRRLNHFKEVERTSTTWGGLDLRRG